MKPNYNELNGMLKDQMKFIVDPKLINESIDNVQKVGSELRNFRLSANRSLEWAADQCDSTRGHLSRIEDNTRSPNSELFRCLSRVLMIPLDEAKELNTLRLLKSRKDKNQDLYDILSLCLELLGKKRNCAIRIALLSLLKSAVARLELNYPKEDIYSAKANISETTKDFRFIPKKFILSFIDNYKRLSSNMESLLVVICLFSKSVVLSEDEYDRIDHNNIKFNPYKYDDFYKQFEDLGIELNPIKCFGDDLGKHIFWELLKN